MLRNKLMLSVVISLSSNFAFAQDAVVPAAPKEAPAIVEVVGPLVRPPVVDPKEEQTRLEAQRIKDFETQWANANCANCQTLRGDSLLSKMLELQDLLDEAKRLRRDDVVAEIETKVASLQEPVFLAKLESIKKRIRSAQDSVEMQGLMDELDVLRAEAALVKPTKARSRYAKRETKNYEQRVLKVQRDVLEHWATKFAKDDAVEIAQAVVAWSESAGDSTEAKPSKILPILNRLVGKASLDMATDVADELITYASSLDEIADADKAATSVIALTTRLTDKAKDTGDLAHIDSAREVLESVQEDLELSAAKTREVKRLVKTGLDMAKDEALALQANGPMSFEYQSHHEELREKLMKDVSSNCSWLFSKSQWANCREAQASYQEFERKDIMAQAGAYEMLKNPLGRGDGINGLNPMQGQANQNQPQAQQQQPAQQPQFQANPMQPVAAAPMQAWNTGVNNLRPMGQTMAGPQMQFGPNQMGPMGMMRR